MTLGAVKPGDIVRIDKRGRIFLAEVNERISETGKRTRLVVTPITSGITFREASASEVIGHWKRMSR